MDKQTGTTYRDWLYSKGCGWTARQAFALTMALRRDGLRGAEAARLAAAS